MVSYLVKSSSYTIQGKTNSLEKTRLFKVCGETDFILVWKINQKHIVSAVSRGVKNSHTRHMPRKTLVPESNEEKMYWRNIYCMQNSFEIV